MGQRRFYDLAIPYFIDPSSHDPVSGFHTSGDHPLRANRGTYLDRADVHLITGTEDDNLMASLHLVHRRLRHQQGSDRKSVV